ncbi:LIM domain-containing protein [Colletotrichum tofieldiae]|nr:LIM domain-containing protein [Colletotrichum tofieldiae]
MDDMQIKTDESGSKKNAPYTKNETAAPPNDETRIYSAALDEASELVWQHQNGVRPPDPHAPIGTSLTSGRTAMPTLVRPAWRCLKIRFWQLYR